jgi:hypothetical protein
MLEAQEEAFTAIFIPVSLAQAVQEVRLPKTTEYRRRVADLLSLRLGFEVPHIGVYEVILC